MILPGGRNGNPLTENPAESNGVPGLTGTHIPLLVST